jgi:O-antigen ligase
VVISLLPFLHGGLSSKESLELVLRAPFFIIPYILFYQSFEWPGTSDWFLSLCFFFATGFLLIYLFLPGFSVVYQSLRTIPEGEVHFLCSRPYFGFLMGILFYLLWKFWISGLKSTVYFGILTLLVVLILWISLAKMALISFLISLIFSMFLQFRNNLKIFGFVLFSSLFLFFFGVKTVLKSRAWADFNEYGLIDFSTVSQTYSNSINNRIILWRAASDVLTKDYTWLTGLNPEDLAKALDQRVGYYNGYLSTQHLNPHNQALYLTLKYGIIGFLAYLFFWFTLFKRIIKNRSPIWLGLWVFVFMCSQTEIYIDLEMGVQLYLFIFFVSFYEDLKSRKLESSPALY